MEQHYHTITEAKYMNKEETQIDCKVDGRDASGIILATKIYPAYSYEKPATKASPALGEIPAIDEVVEIVDVPERTEYLCRFAPSVIKFIEDGGVIAPYAPHVDTNEELLEASDAKMLKLAVRKLEDLVLINEANGGYISPELKAHMDYRKSLRPEKKDV